MELNNYIEVENNSYEIVINLHKYKRLETMLGKSITDILSNISLSNLEAIFNVFVNTGAGNGSTKQNEIFEKSLNKYGLEGLLTLFVENMQAQTPFLFQTS